MDRSAATETTASGGASESSKPSDATTAATTIVTASSASDAKSAAGAAAFASAQFADADTRTTIVVTETPLNITSAFDAVSSPTSGAIASFIGTTRDNFKGRKVVRLEYEGYVPMAVKELRRICCEARAKWPELEGIAVHHRLGVVPVGEASVVIAVASPHRRDGLEAVSFLIDTLKMSVPIWKLEVYEGDSRVWKENCECTHGPHGVHRAMEPVEDGSSGGEGGAD